MAKGRDRSASQTSRKQLASLGPSQREARRRALETLTLMRRDGRSLSAAAREAGTTPRTVRRYAGDALQRSGGRVRARPGDRLLRIMNVLSTDGHVTVLVRGSRSASLIAEHANAIQRYLSTGYTSLLAPYEGKRVAGLTLETDPDRIEAFAMAGELDFEDIYDEPTSG